MSDALVIGLDSSTQSTKAIAWDRMGTAVAEGRADISMQNPQLDHFEQNPEDWWTAALQAITDCVAQVDATLIEGIAISNQRETLALLDATGQASYPAILWLDERCRDEVVELSELFGAENIHRITGRPPDMTPCMYSIRWLQQNEPQALENTAHLVDVQAYLVTKLCGGPYRTGWPSADPMGFIDMESKTWSKPLMAALSLDESKLAQLHAPGSKLGTVLHNITKQTGLPKNTPVFAGGGDGQCAGLGVNCTVPARAYINLGTAVVAGIWSPHYQYDRAWRTEIAAQGNGYIYESCLRSGAFLINWFVEQFVSHGKADAAVFLKLEAQANELPVGSNGLLVQPYFSGVMNPHWDSEARGVILGLSGSHSVAHIYRAILEAISIDQVMGLTAMEQAANQPITELVAIGGGANSSLWRQMLADASGKAVHVSTTIEASALGAGMIAAYGAGWYPSIEDAAVAMCGDTTAFEPNARMHNVYAELTSIYSDLFHATANINHRMLAFAAEHK